MKKKCSTIFYALCLCIGMSNLNAQTNSDCYHYYDYVVNSDQVWDVNSLPINNNAESPNDVLRINHQLTVNTGSTLIVNSDVQLEFGSNGRITVEPGAELIVDGASLTKACDGYWNGIEVFGDALKQQTSAHQGKVQLINGATIEFAKNGVSLIGHNDDFDYIWGTSGGILHADDATFKNCLTAVELMEYKNHKTTGEEIRNISVIVNSTIEVDNEINTVFNFGDLKGISLWGVDGVTISACNFVNNITETNPDLFNENEGIAIVAHNASFRLTAGYEGGALDSETDESLYTRNRVQGFACGVDVNNIDELTSVSIDRTDFENNRVGAFLRNTKSARLVRNAFEVPRLTSNLEIDNDISTVGAHFKHSNRYIIEENLFYGINDGAFDVDDLDAGLIIESSGKFTDDRVYRNNFDKLSYASMVYGTNGGKTDGMYRGLEFKGNDYGYNTALGTNTLNYKDIYLYSDAVIDHVQGIASASIEEPAGNRFKEKSVPNGHIDIASTICKIEHYYHHNDPFTIPENSDDSKIQPTNTGNVYGAEKNDPIPSQFTYGPLTLDPYQRVVVENIRGDYAVLDDNYNAILNGGLTPEIMEVLMDDFASSSSIYEMMALGSPYLSDDILIAAMTRQISMNQWHLAELLVWNGPLSRRVMEVFKDVQPLTPYLAGIVYGVEGSSQRHLLELDLKSVREKIAVMEADYIHTALFDESLDNGYQEIYDLYADVNSAEAMRIKISVMLHQGLYGDAQALLNNYMAENNDNYGSFKQIDIDLQQSGLNWFQMSDVQLESIHQIANDTEVFGAEKAQAVLSLINGSDETNYSMPIAEAAEMRQTNNTQFSDAIHRSLIAVSPNPAAEGVYVTYELPESYQEATLQVHNAIGQCVDHIDVGNFRHVFKMNCETYETGLYFVSLLVDGFVVESTSLSVMQK